MLLKPHRNSVNEPIKIWGVTFMEFAAISIPSIVLLVLVIIPLAFGVIPSYIIFLIPVLWGILLRQLQKSNRHGHPEYLRSWVAYKFLHPKIIVIKDPTFYARKVSGDTKHS